MKRHDRTVVDMFLNQISTQSSITTFIFTNIWIFIVVKHDLALRVKQKCYLKLMYYLVLCNNIGYWTFQTIRWRALTSLFWIFLFLWYSLCYCGIGRKIYRTLLEILIRKVHIRIFFKDTMPRYFCFYDVSHFNVTPFMALHFIRHL